MPSLPRSLHAASGSELKDRLQAARSDTPFVMYRDRDERQRIVVLSRRDSLTIGRQPASDVALSWDAAVSRVHATLERVGDEWTLVDDGSSRNGSFLNGERVHGRRLLRDGDIIRIGSTTIAYLVPRERDGSPSTAAMTSSRVPQFSTAQRRVLVALCRPLVMDRFGSPGTNRQIADELVLGVQTVKSHMQALVEAFGIQDLPQNQKRAELARLALEHGAVTEDELVPNAPYASARQRLRR